MVTTEMKQVRGIVNVEGGIAVFNTVDRESLTEKVMLLMSLHK